MAIELLTCTQCGNDWTRKITHGSGPAPDVCADCAAAAVPRAPTGVGTDQEGSDGAAPLVRLPRHDPDIPVAFASAPLDQALRVLPRMPAVCLQCATTWDATPALRQCPACGSAHGRAVLDRSQRGEDIGPPMAAARRFAPRFAGKLEHVRGVGSAVAKTVAEHYLTLEKLATADPDELAALPGVGRRRAERMIRFAQNAHDTAPTSPDRNSVYGILAAASGVGDGTARLVSERYHTLEQVAATDPEELTALRGIGIQRARRVVDVAQQRIARQRVESELAGRLPRVADPPPEPCDALPHGPQARTDGDLQASTDADPQSADDEPADDDRSWTNALALVACVLCNRPLLDLPGRTQAPLCEHCDTGRVIRGARHGVGTAIKKGCRCGECVEALATTRGWVSDRIAGATLQEIADGAGITRERVRQILEMFAPLAPWDTVARVERAERAEVQAVAAAAREQDHLKSSQPCPTCGGTVPQPGRRFCSSDCRERWDVLRWHIDEDRRASHRWHAAQWTVDNPDAVGDIQLRYARRVLEGTAGSNEDHRWLIEGSQPFKVAVEAVVNRWPLADLLPVPVRLQVDEYLGLSVRDWRKVLTAEVMRIEYLDRQQTPSAIAQKLGFPVEDVYAALERHSIPRRRGGPGRARESWGDVLTAEFLQREYVERGRSGSDIAEEVGCNSSAVYAWLQRHAISRRGGGHPGYSEE